VEAEEEQEQEQEKRSQMTGKWDLMWLVRGMLNERRQREGANDDQGQKPTQREGKGGARGRKVATVPRQEKDFGTQEGAEEEGEEEEPTEKEQN
jgi:hypothetical protein